jgi:dTDP-4-amino-4,6-dideoxygalactose transaminase
MLSAVSRYGARVLPNTEQIIGDAKKRGALIRGPQIEAFESAFAARLGVPKATATSFGRMAFYYLLKALRLPPGSEIIFPALTFWVVPEIARQAGLVPVFADVDSTTFTLDPRSFERAITDRTRAVVPTHLYGLACEMDAIVGIARRHGLAVIEDCAHALGANYRGKPLGTLGDASFFSFQTLKPLNTYGGGMAVARDVAVGQRVAELAAAEPWPDEKGVSKKLLTGKLQRIFIRPRVFSVSLFPILWASSWFQATPDVYLWEKIRPLSPLPPNYTERYSNVQAALGLEGLKHLDGWTADTQRHAHRMNEMLAGLPGVQPPQVPADRNHVYYQYCVYCPDRGEVMRRCIQQGVDIETLHVDVCSRLDLFGAQQISAPGAERAAEALQMPVYSTLTDAQVEVVGQRVRRVLEQWNPARAADATRAPSA